MIFDLSHPLTNHVPIWEEIPQDNILLGNVIVPYEKGAEIQQFSFPGQYGTHIDFPAHFFEDGKRLKDFSVEDMVLDCIVIDISEKVKQSPDTCISMADVEIFEKIFGNIPKNSFVALRTDWSKRWPENMHGVSSPGWSLEVLKFLFEKRHIKAVGHETMDTDSSEVIAAKGYICEEYVLASGHFQVELLNHLDQLPATGSKIVIAPIHVPDANGMPIRPIAITA